MKWIKNILNKWKIIWNLEKRKKTHSCMGYIPY